MPSGVNGANDNRRKTADPLLHALVSFAPFTPFGPFAIRQLRRPAFPQSGTPVVCRSRFTYRQLGALKLPAGATIAGVPLALSAVFSADSSVVLSRCQVAATVASSRQVAA